MCCLYSGGRGFFQGNISPIKKVRALTKEFATVANIRKVSPPFLRKLWDKALLLQNSRIFNRYILFLTLNEGNRYLLKHSKTQSDYENTNEFTGCIAYC